VFKHIHSESGHFLPTLVTDEFCKDCSHFHVMGRHFFSRSIIDAMNKAISVVKSNDGRFLSTEYRKEMLKITEMREAFGLILDRRHLSPARRSQLLVAPKRRRGPLLTIAAWNQGDCRKARRGSATFYDSKQRIAMPAIPVVKSITGAGDCFGATYVTCRNGEIANRGNAGMPWRWCRSSAKKGPMEGTSTFANSTKCQKLSMQDRESDQNVIIVRFMTC